MAFKNSYSSYGSINKFFHWLIFFLIAGLFIIGFSVETYPKSFQKLFIDVHKLIGIIVLGLMLLRLLWISINPKPQLALPLWERIAEKTVHGLLYLTLLAMPISGWIMATADGKPPHLFALTLPFPYIPTSEAISNLG